MNQKTLNIIYGIVIVVLIGTVVYFVVGKKSIPVVQQPTPTPTPTQVTNTPKSNPTPTPTTQNETFVNSAYGYKIDLPKNWKMYSEYDGSVIANSSPKNFQQNPGILTGEPPTLDFQISLSEGVDINGTNNVGESNKVFFLRDLSFVKNMTVKSGEVGEKYQNKNGNGYSFLIQTKKGLLRLTLNNNNSIFDGIVSSLILIK